MKPSEDKGSVLAESLRHEKVDERVNGSGGFREQRSNQTKLSRDLLEYCVFSRENESKTIAGDMIMIIIIIIILIIILVIIISRPKPPYGWQGLAGGQRNSSSRYKVASKLCFGDS